MEDIQTASSADVTPRASGARKRNPHIEAAIEHLSGVDLADPAAKDMVMIPAPQEGTVDRNGNEVTPQRHRQRVACTVQYLRRAGRVPGMRLRVLQDTDGNVWIKRAQPIEKK